MQAISRSTASKLQLKSQGVDLGKCKSVSVISRPSYKAGALYVRYNSIILLSVMYTVNDLIYYIHQYKWDKSVYYNFVSSVFGQYLLSTLLYL